MNALRHGLAAAQSQGGVRWEQKTQLSLKETSERLQLIELERLKLLRDIDLHLANGSSKGLASTLERLARLERYIKRAHARMK
jgi:hypothetical protein